MLKLKICGMRDSTNIEEVGKLNPDLMGFIFYPKSKRYVGKDFNPVILKNLSPDIKTVAVFVNESIEQIIQTISKYKFSYVQLHGSETPEYCISLKNKGIKILKAFGIHSSFEWSILPSYQDACDYFLFDTSTSDYGGSGKKFGWELLDNYHGSKPFFLSGGIEPQDGDKIAGFHHPSLAGIDINSRFEIEPGLKDVCLLHEFSQKLKKA
jgi:phosphoribosylanthranilate isomerase